MYIFKYIGGCLILVGLGSGAGIFLEPFGLHISGSTFTMWLLFILCFVGGFFMYAIGAEMKDANGTLRTAGSFLLVYGLVSAASLLMDKVGLLQPSGTFALWALFLLCTVSGTVAVIAADGSARKSEDKETSKVLNELVGKDISE